MPSENCKRPEQIASMLGKRFRSVTPPWLIKPHALHHFWHRSKRYKNNTQSLPSCCESRIAPCASQPQLRCSCAVACLSRCRPAGRPLRF